MYIIQKIKGIIYDNADITSVKKEKINKKVHVNELKDEIWLYKNEYNKENVNEEYDKEIDDNEYDDDENEKQPTDHFLEVPLFDEDDYGKNIKRRIKDFPNKKINSIKRYDETEMSEETLSTTYDDEEIDEPFLDLYEELKREQKIREFYNPMLKPRLWRLEFFIKYIHNLENNIQKNFYLISFGNTKNINLYGGLQNDVLYTPGYSIKPGEIQYLKIPLTIWSEKELSISYEDLKKFEVTIEMWCIKGLIFNDLYASSKINLKEIIENDPDSSIVLKRKIEKNKMTFEAQRLGIYMQLSEIFEFHMALDSWWFIANSEMPNYLKLLPKFLRFKFPLSEGEWVIHSSNKSNNNFWLYPGYFCFIGTYRQLANAFFILAVLCYNSNYRYKPPILLGSCIVSLKSVTEYPFFKGTVKKLTLEKRKFKQGEIVGNIKCFVNSYGIQEDDTNIQRPVQPLSDVTLVNQLSLNDHYLVIRIIKCENLAISSIDLNNININVWVKWDGIVNKTDIVSKTVSPFFYQNLYYPIRLVDKKELTNEKLIHNVLPIDLISKGDICLEVHNNNEIYSSILGIFELPFSDIFNYGTYDYRGLVQDNNSSSIYNENKNYDFYDQEFDNPDENYEDYYSRQYKTIVYKNTLDLMYSRAHLKSLNKGNAQTKRKSTISIEAFVIPPLPSGLVFFKENQSQNSSIIYKSMSKRWDQDFKGFNDIYLQWFPKAIKNRSFPCISKNEFDDNYYPLCSFVTPINLPAQVSTPGPLFHWLNNIEYIENDDESTNLTPPHFFLSYKKGTIQDHAILLCCCLKGLEYDAYVCKGTINNGKTEHYWVMTRHEKGWVCFWEVTNKSIIHLKDRWNNNNFLKNFDILAENKMINKINENDNEKYYNGEYLVSYIKYGLEELKNRKNQIIQEYDIKEENQLYTMDLYGEHLMKDEEVNIDELLYNDEEFFDNIFKVKYEKNKTYNCNKAIKYVLESFSKHIPIAPKFGLLNYENTLAYVPYTSIEVIFNDQQVYGNMQNHHPACILYDLENNYHWRPFLNHEPPQIKSEITISTPLSDKLSIKYMKELEEELQEMIFFIRNVEGLETNFDHSKEIKYFLEMYIDICEYKLNLDNNFNPKPENYEYKNGKEIEKNVNNGSMSGNKENSMENMNKINDNNIYNNESKKSWSQYKNDFYPNIEGQYINKENINFHNSYHPAKNVEIMNSEKKKKLSNIPQDYVYGMNNEIYNDGKEEYIKNYVFNKNSTDILNNYDEKIKSKNIKRFSNVPLHHQYNEQDINWHLDIPNYIYNCDNIKKEKDINDDIDCNDNPRKGDKIRVVIDDEKEKNIYNEYCVEHNCEEYEEEIYKEIKERYYRCDDSEFSDNITHKNIPRKYMKNNNNILKLEKKLKKYEKIMKKEMIDIKLARKGVQDKNKKKLFSKFLDAQEYLMNNLENKNYLNCDNNINEIKIGNEDNAEIYHNNLNCKQNSNWNKYNAQNIKEKNIGYPKCGKMKYPINGYFIIPSKSSRNNIYTFVDVGKNEKKNYKKKGDREKVKVGKNDKQCEKKKRKNNFLNMCKKSYNIKLIDDKNLNKKWAIKKKYNKIKVGKFRLGGRIHISGKRKNKLFCENISFFINSNIIKNNGETQFLIDKEATNFTKNKKFAYESIHQMYISETEGKNNHTIAEDQSLKLDTQINQKWPMNMLNESNDENIIIKNKTIPKNFGELAMGKKFEKNENGENKSEKNISEVSPPKTWSRLDTTSKYAAHQISQWNWYYALEEQYFNWQYYKFPVPANHTFVGFPIHFSTPDFSEIKTFLLNSKRFDNIMKLSINNISFVIYCKSYPLIGGVMSNWVFLGCLVPWMTTQEREINIKKRFHRNHNER
ncbi:centrosomal protein CEP76, putative [Plasmodium berghei]|uniref:Centrosomal protein CEP76, putative n=2 Tax=Plasmodium berghei TaxID=5821 RepID=A0A509ACQ1_PLABA|nr:centrosomal protein CEP76, putative [Plasmodium berghei ANKA]CXH80133.1 centrosomal protein CEP76, putative [Plasmodium berghei]SCM19008.1 centrosomal protein CEP76, putative [Plasmodium berghei]SCN21542.1 centrosomal protein CEP76, putative [Plasmodium berghei]SCO58815.1 centrosomal protein CEP76, putative [Plasmodium berghei]VUC53762.1 centrosomal protein CEP76, putative [Plasmodium berghei ANKA]|eukprot:XP_034419626.1 centrosomal protein CEP76, putative [Plasmodium berghei ANKA]